ncbi:preprotein translocase subunit SecE [bacterium]|nr:preprotein translocase subunit SecE [bacterium]
MTTKDKIVEYFKGVKTEWGKITWPDRKQVVTQTVIVIIVVAFFTTLVYLSDIIFKWVLTSLHLQA